MSEFNISFAGLFFHKLPILKDGCSVQGAILSWLKLITCNKEVSDMKVKTQVKSGGTEFKFD